MNKFKIPLMEGTTAEEEVLGEKLVERLQEMVKATNTELHFNSDEPGINIDLSWGKGENGRDAILIEAVRTEVDRFRVYYRFRR